MNGAVDCWKSGNFSTYVDPMNNIKATVNRILNLLHFSLLYRCITFMSCMKIQARSEVLAQLNAIPKKKALNRRNFRLCFD